LFVKGAIQVLWYCIVLYCIIYVFLYALTQPEDLPLQLQHTPQHNLVLDFGSLKD